MKKDNFLEDILVGKWEKIALQGGLEQKPFHDDKFYLISNIYFFHKNKWIDMGIIETVQDEVFELYCSIMDYAPIPETNVIYKPPRKLVTEFPADCPLDELMEYGVKAIKYDSYTFNNDNEVTIKGTLIIVSHTGKQFILSPSYDSFYDIELYRLIY